MRPRRLLLFASLLLAACGDRPLQDILQADPNLQPEGATPAITGSCDRVTRSRLPRAFPNRFCYPNADLQQVTETTQEDDSLAIDARWTTQDDAAQVREFYQAAFEQEGWETTTTADSRPLEAVKDGVRVAVDLAGGAEATPFTVSYRPTVQAAVAEEEPADLEEDPDEDSTEATRAAIAPGPAQSFTDVGDAPEDFQAYIRDLAALGVLDAGEGDQFQPNAPVTRRTFARWLYNANNAFYTESAKRIRAATGDAVFQDLSSSNPDFESVQGLADAGIIPSPLSGEATVVNFRPDAPLTRETLLQWKVPLDLRRSLPNATVEAVAEAWGFQGAAKIDPNALQAVLADYANGNQANIRRAFGFTTLFQPQKPVTRAEAAAALWQFGYQGDGLSAAQVRRGDTGVEEADEGKASSDTGEEQS